MKKRNKDQSKNGDKINQKQLEELNAGGSRNEVNVITNVEVGH